MSRPTFVAIAIFAARACGPDEDGMLLLDSEAKP